MGERNFFLPPLQWMKIWEFSAFLLTRGTLYVLPAHHPSQKNTVAAPIPRITNLQPPNTFLKKNRLNPPQGFDPNTSPWPVTPATGGRTSVTAFLVLDRLRFFSKARHPSPPPSGEGSLLFLFPLRPPPRGLKNLEVPSTLRGENASQPPFVVFRLIRTAKNSGESREKGEKDRKAEVREKKREKQC